MGSTIGLEVGKTYTVKLDSGNYTAVCKEETKDGITARTLGNTSIYGEGEDTGESFLVSEVFTAEESVIIIVDRNQGTHAEIIDLAGETIHPIDPKYLPGVCLPVVEITDVSNITTEESAKLTACIGMPCVIKFGTFSGLYDYADDGGHCFLNSNGHAFISEDGVSWAHGD
jgi:hypothetical protein